MNPSHLVIARKHRPRFFRDVVGQDPVVRILENSMRLNRSAHAYLLVGPRGVGKTSTARIMAMALNSPEKEGGDYDPTHGDFQDIAEGRHPDVLELDAATNSGVDNMRNLLEEASYTPTRLRYRIYLIDEVHMLSQAAFNALLKTLEEPPPRVKFILATTESRKVPITIKSRCQKLELRLLPEDLISRSLLAIAELDQFKLEPAAAMAIAEASGGSMRDAQTALEQIVAFTEGNVTEKEVTDLWGGLPAAKILLLATHILKGEANDSWDLLEEATRKGKDFSMIALSLLKTFRKAQREIYSRDTVTPTGLKNLIPPRKLLLLLSSLDRLNVRLDTSMDPSSLFTQWAMEACEGAKRPDLLDMIERLSPEEQVALQSTLSRISPS